MDPNAGWWETDVAKKGDRKRSMTSTEKNGWRNVCWVDLTFADKLLIGSDEIDDFEQDKICVWIYLVQGERTFSFLKYWK